MAETMPITQPQATEAAATEDKRCKFCGEEAAGMTENGIYLCGIPTNHPEYDNEELFPIVPPMAITEIP